MTMRIYLAGPEMFHPKAKEIAARKHDLCFKYGLEGLHPAENELADEDGSALKIFAANRSLMRQADAIIANLSPFRGPSADVGTVFELGFLHAYDRPCIGYANIGDVRVRDYCARVLNPETAFRDNDPNGMRIENFGLYDNLMVAVPLKHLAIRVTAEPWTDLTGFEECLIFLKGLASAKR